MTDIPLHPTPVRWRLVNDEAPRQPALFGQPVQRHVGKGEYRGLEFLEVEARRVLNKMPERSPMPFRWTINAYRGCSHACTYCFARPTHAYLGLGIGDDFDRRIVVKVNAVEQLRTEIAHPAWRGEHVAMGTNTDPYQKAEGRYRLTRGIIGVLAAAANPFSILTKSTLVLRDLDLLADAARQTSVRLDLSVGTLDTEVWRLTEPGTPHPLRRLDAVRKLNEAGIPCGVLIGPIIPGLSDKPGMVEAVGRAAVAAGAVGVSHVALHLRPGVRQHFLDWLAAARPDLVADYQRWYAGRSQLPLPARRQLSVRLASALDGVERPSPARDPRRGADRRPTDRSSAEPPRRQLRLRLA